MESMLPPIRFIVTLGNILALSIARQGLNKNIQVSLDPEYNRSDGSLYDEPYPNPYPTSSDQAYFDQYQTLQQSTTAAIHAAYVCLAIDLLGLMSGSTLFWKRVNFFQILLHFWGSVFTCWFISELIPSSQTTCSLKPHRPHIPLWHISSSIKEYALKAQVMWNIVGWTNIPTALMELFVLVMLCYTQRPTYW